MQPVTVITTVLNEAGDIDRLVESLMRQSLAPAEIIVVDGGSTDSTWERLEAEKSRHPTLIPIRDESCRLPHSPGPISRGRNVAISAATSEIIACVDAGCTYRPDWLAQLTAPIVNGTSEYALGGSCLDPDRRTVWDIASAPFFGVKLNPDAKTKSCTARSMAFRKDLWRRIGGFPEDIFFGEDTVFDLKARTLTTPAFVQCAKAFYSPDYTLRSALSQLARYSISDGVAGVRPARLMRNLLRCVAEVAVLALAERTVLPLLVVLILELYFGFRLDWRDLRGAPLSALASRFFFSLLVPWVVTWNQIKGAVTKKSAPNRQNLG